MDQFNFSIFIISTDQIKTNNLILSYLPGFVGALNASLLEVVL